MKIPWILSFYSYSVFLWSTTTTTPVNALCSVHDDKGNRVALTAVNLPRGIAYDRQRDILECLSTRACQGWKIVGCDALYCTGPASCEQATLTDHGGVACWELAACQGARISAAHDISCGAGFDRSCAEAVIETDAQLLCYGQDACVHGSSNNKNDFMVIHIVGYKGHVRCANGDDGPACENLVVHVPDSSRACLVDDMHRGNGHDTISPCAVVCATDKDCDAETIHFQVRTKAVGGPK